MPHARTLAALLALATLTLGTPAHAADTWRINCHTQPYGYRQTTASNGAISHRFEVRAGDQFAGDANNYTDGRQRCERKNLDWHAPWRADTWMAYDFRWSGAMPTGARRHTILHQFQQTPEACDTVGKPPTLTLRHLAGQLVLSTRGDTRACTTSQPPAVDRWARPWLVPGHWYRIVMRANFDPTAGSVTLWINGSRVYTSGPIPLGYNDAVGPHFAHGIYRAGATQTTVFEYANVALGTDSLLWRVSSPPLLPR